MRFRRIRRDLGRLVTARGAETLARRYSREQSLRAELLTIGQLREYAILLAGRHDVDTGRGPDVLLPRLAENQSTLVHAYGLISGAVEKKHRISPASEWLLDNFYLIEEQILTARHHLPPGYSQELPRLRQGGQIGYPRVYDIAFNLVSHTDGQIDAEHLTAFIAAYQSVVHLELGELWAVPIMLRLSLIENLRRIAARIIAERIDRNSADYWADRLIETAESEPKDLVISIADLAKSGPTLSNAFVMEFIHRLQGQTPALAFCLTWIEQRISEEGRTGEQMIQEENRHQAANQVSVSNSIGTLRFLDTMDWREFVETVSVVDRRLRTDPAGVYAGMSFGTRDRYRHVVEEIARKTRLSEAEVADAAIALAKYAGRTSPPSDRKVHVGYYLVEEGRRLLEKMVRMRPVLKDLLRRAGRHGALAWYLSAVLLVTGAVTAGLLARTSLPAQTGWAAAAGLLLFFCLIQAGLTIVNWLATILVEPHSLPRMDFSKGLPADVRTLVAVPTIIDSRRTVQRLLEGLELRYLSNRREYLHFALLTDFPDASAETMPGDDDILREAADGIRRLNEQYGDGRAETFFLLHRPRRWNAREKKWMGYERKRGKLTQLNAFLRGRGAGFFSSVVGDTGVLPMVRYVITLDSDTHLPYDAALRLVETMAHPLNRPVYDPALRRVTAGYGILQPRVAVNLPSAGRSRYAALFSGDPGVDPYTRVVSDVYQDLFHEGSFIGKGIYEVDTFIRTLDELFPENLILSHDLIEGCYARSGLASDVEIFEDFPAQYVSDMSRRHRWIRGDWQIIGWLLPRVPGPAGRWLPNPLSALSRWKILDNLRRSLSPCVLMLLLALGWTVLGDPLFWTIAVAGIVVLPPLLVSAGGLVLNRGGLPWLLHLQAAMPSLRRQLLQAAYSLIFIMHEALVNLDAVVRTLGRLLLRRHLLEWQTAASQSGRSAYLSAAGYGRYMSAVLVVPALVAVLVLLRWPSAVGPAIFFLAAWWSSPFLAWWLSRPQYARSTEFSREDRLLLRRTARRTWRFFETFVTEERNWLPPDNFQEYPEPLVAERTSPTNIGLSLLAHLAAYDFGYLSASTLLARVEGMCRTLGKLERFEGHFYNWYDTRTLKPLPPRYVSTVDSGNLAAHLLVLRQGLLEIVRRPILQMTVFQGLRDTLDCLREETGKNSVLDALRERLPAIPPDLGEGCRLLREVAVVARETAEAESLSEEAAWWAAALRRQAEDFLAHTTDLARWILDLPEGGDGAEVADISAALTRIRTLEETVQEESEIVSALDRPAAGEVVGAAVRAAAGRMAALEAAASQLQFFAEMNYEFLYDPSRNLLVLGYRVEEHKRDTVYYDLLASEARLGSFVGIARGDLPPQHWFALGRLLTTVHGEMALLSWSGSLFEYLMPLLVMPFYESTLLDRTCRTVVDWQIHYGGQRGVPWGVSESCYNTTDANLVYQYSSFGVPGLGFKRGLADDLVVAPYASALALMVRPVEACANLRRLANEGFRGKFGFYEAVDYTPVRLARNQSYAVIRSFMAHHQGMSLLSFAYVLLDKPMQRRFLAESMFRAAQILLQERMPTVVPFHPHTAASEAARRFSGQTEAQMRVFTTPHTAHPEVHLLSNNRYQVMITNSGGGYSRWKDLAITRWREDPTCDSYGFFCYIKDTTSRQVWSSTFQPTGAPARNYEAIFLQARAEFRRRDGDFYTYTEIAVSPEDDVELRRITVTNRSLFRRTLEFTSYGELVLAPPAADLTHPAFSNLFVETEIVRSHQALLCTRRPRSVEEKPPWVFHLMTAGPDQAGTVSYETDRSVFLGRGRTAADPAAVETGGDLSNSAGPVLDPAMAIRCRVDIGPEQSLTVYLVTGVAATRPEALSLLEKYRERPFCDRIFDVAWTHSSLVLQQLNITESDAQLYGRLAGSIIYANPIYRAADSILMNNRRRQSDLWGYGISGDLPLVLLRIRDESRLDLVRQLVLMHAYWRVKGLTVDLLIWNEDTSGYRQLLQDRILGIIAAGPEAHALDARGGVFIRHVDQISNEDRVLMQATARVIFSDTRGSLVEQMDRRGKTGPDVPVIRPVRPERAGPEPGPAARDLVCFNGWGGFTRDGREYVVVLPPGTMTPAPWANVLANPSFGTLVSEAGLGYTWFENAHEFRLSPWFNDPVTDAAGETIYLRDEETGQVWSPTPRPCPAPVTYVIRHGFGYTVYECTYRGVTSELWVYVSRTAPVKFSVLKLRNHSGRDRRLTATNCVELVLAEHREKSALHVTTRIDAKTGALFAQNRFSPEFARTVVFLDVNDAARTVTGDRREFLGRNGSRRDPAALKRTNLSGRTGAGMDPCAALQAAANLPDGQEKEIVFRLGAAGGEEEARSLVQASSTSGAARQVLEENWAYWNRVLGAVQVETPDLLFNLPANGWLLYQTLSGRLWGRTGYYQSSGAYGFRDQLQDGLALVHTAPDLLREHLVRCAGRQFLDGDVQHWWHPPAGRGLRTRFSDDYLWLPLALCRYVETTGDTGILDEIVPFIQGRPLNPGEQEYYDLPWKSDQSATLYEHCARAVRLGLRCGAHGLPLMGSGDWNDGMNLVGAQGKGESVWLAFFLHQVLRRFAGLARLKNDQDFARECEEQAVSLEDNLAKHGWDGAWYLRAYDDNGRPLGSARNEECRIDSVPQSWAVLSGVGSAERAAQAMNSLERILWRKNDGLVLLLHPPFDVSDQDPGYIKGYVPGVRENGGHYTHAAVWAAMAFAGLGDPVRAWDVFTCVNSASRSDTPEKAARYRVEPYVAAADIYSRPPHTGRGGWTWYTGAAGWMYQLLMESIAGLRLAPGRLTFSPCPPPHWRSYTIHYRYRETTYHLAFSIPEGGRAVQKVILDGAQQPDLSVPLVDDRKDHRVEILLG